MQAGTLDPQNLVVGGSKGLRYIIKGTSVVEHGSDAGALISDRLSAMLVSPERLQPKDAT